MRLRIELFAVAVSVVGEKTIEVDCSNDETVTVAVLRENIIKQYPGLAGLVAISMIAVDHEYANPDRKVLAGSEIGLIPPVSGG